jgi:hypothetical protein
METVSSVQYLGDEDFSGLGKKIATIDNEKYSAV